METKKAGWQITFHWVIAHAGIRSNEPADTLAKKAATNKTITESYKRIPKYVVLSDLVKESVRKWQSDWTQTTKGSTTKEYFPVVEDRLKMKLNLTGNFITIVTEHGNMKAYLNRFQITDETTCPWGKGDHTVEHIIYECERLTKI